MPNEETNPTSTAETAQETQPATGADTSTTDTRDADTQAMAQPATGDETAKWKAMSRKNERQAEANLRQLQQTQAELAKARADNARLTAKAQHPQISDDVLSLCSETEPDRIAEWANRYAALNPIAPPKPAHTDPLARHTLALAENPQGAYDPQPAKGDAYKRTMERQAARRHHRK